MMAERIEAAAGILLDARRDQRQAGDLPAHCRPATAADAYAVQDAVARRLGAVAGWKTAAPNPETTPIAPPLFAASVVASPATLTATQFHMIGIEAEIAFRIGRDLPPRATEYTTAEVVAAVEALHPVVEVVDSRLADWQDVDPLWRLADNQTNGALVYGPGLADWQAIDLMRQPVRLSIDGAVVVGARGGNPGGDPVRLLTWLVNHCTAHRGGLPAGQLVTTGSYTGMLFAPPGATVLAAFAAIGEVAIRFADG